MRCWVSLFSQNECKLFLFIIRKKVKSLHLIIEILHKKSCYFIILSGLCTGNHRALHNYNIMLQKKLLHWLLRPLGRRVVTGWLIGKNITDSIGWNLLVPIRKFHPDKQLFFKISIDNNIKNIRPVSSQWRQRIETSGGRGLSRTNSVWEIMFERYLIHLCTWQ